jgi:hypothetical protein
MAVNLPAPVLPALVPATTGAPVAPVAAVAPAALLASAEEGGLTLPFSQSLPAGARAPAPESGAEGPAMRPDQLMMARQLAYPALRGDALAAGWQSMVRTYGAQAARRAVQEQSGHLAPAVLVAGQEGRVLRPLDPHANPLDAWRFTVHAGGAHAHTLRVIGDEDEPARRRHARGRAALRLELVLEDGTRVVVQVEPLPYGLAIELCAPDKAAAERLRALQPELERVIKAAGLEVLRWRFRDSLPAGRVHASSALEAAAGTLNLPVFRAVAELALLLPALSADQSAQA